jgi:hypothetical protein
MKGGRLEPFGKQRKEFGEAEGPRGSNERARASQFKPGDKIKVTADEDELIFKTR